MIERTSDRNMLCGLYVSDGLGRYIPPQGYLIGLSSMNSIQSKNDYVGVGRSLHVVCVPLKLH